MEENYPGGMSHLDRLLQKHKQLEKRSVFKSSHQPQVNHDNMYISHMTQRIPEYPTGSYNYYNTINCIPQERPSTVTAGKVYINPNYTKRKPVIHINPHMQVKPSIYVNPKLIKNITHSQNQDTVSNVTQNIGSVICSTNSGNIQGKHSVHVNPKLMDKLIFKPPEIKSTIGSRNNNPSAFYNSINTLEVPVTQSPSLAIAMDNSSHLVKKQPINSVTSDAKTKPIIFNAPVSQRRLSANYIIKSKTKLVKGTNSLKKSPNSSFIALSRRKLVRVKRSSKAPNAVTSSIKQSTPLRRKLSNSGLKKAKISHLISRSKTLILRSSIQLSKKHNLKIVKSVDTYRLNFYNKIDRTILKSSCKKKELNNKGLVSIGGIMYKKSRNQLVRSNSGTSSLKRKRSLASSKSNQYYIAKNGKKLLKLDSARKKIDTSMKRNTSITNTKNYKTNISNKVKQRSLQILRDKMRKNNQPCLLFQKFGYCANQVGGTCPKVHDKKQVALCKKFLQGKCLLDKCPLSHNVGPEKMPTCKYFLEGCCTRDGCPYLHVKVSSKNPICVEFLRGFCRHGNECQNRHTYACPEFDKTSKCSKGKSCPYPHKSKLTETKTVKGGVRRKNTAMSAKRSENIIKTPTGSRADECRKRYYENVNVNANDNDDFEQQVLNAKREKITRYIEIMKNVHTAESGVPNKEKGTEDKHLEDADVENNSSSEQKQEITSSRPKRPPIGPLPAYIPID